jgi:hypothetical protein
MTEPEVMPTEDMHSRSDVTRKRARAAPCAGVGIG